MGVYKDLKKLSSKYHNFDKGMLQFRGEQTAVIKAEGRDLDFITHDYSLDVLPIADAGFIEYVQQRARIVPLKYDIELDLEFEKKLNEEEEQKVKEVVKRAFAEDAVLLKRETKRNVFHALMFLLGGVFAFLMYYISQVHNFDFIIGEIFTIVSWALIWETSEIFFIRRTKNKRHLLEIIRLWNANINILTKAKKK